MISSGATAGVAGGRVRFQLDPDTDQTPVGATMSEDGSFHWTPSEDQVGDFTFTVIAVNRDNFCEADAERFTISVRPMNEAPEVGEVPDQSIPHNSELSVVVEATDPNEGDPLSLEVVSGPEFVSVEQTGSGQWVVHWSPDPGTPPGTYGIELQVSDGELTDRTSFNVELTNVAPSVDLNGPDAVGTGTSQDFVEGQGAVPVAVDVTIADADDSVLQWATAQIVTPMDGPAESLSVDTSGTNIWTYYDADFGTLILFGEDTVENYQRVLASLTYNNELQDPHTCPRQIEVTVDDGWNVSEVATATVHIVAVNQGPNLILPAPYDNEATPVEVEVGTSIEFPTEVVDPDSTDFKYILDLDNSGLPAEASQPMINPYGTFAWTPDTVGTFEITVIVLDEHGAADRETFTVTVEDHACHHDDDGETAVDPSDVLFAHDRDGQLFTVNVDSGDINIIGLMSEQMFDIAFDNDGNLFGISDNGDLYSIDPETAAISLIGSTGEFINALEFSPTGELYGAGEQFYSINPVSGSASAIGDLNGFTSDGDLAFGDDGRLLLAAENDQLVEVDVATGAAALVTDVVQPGVRSLDLLGLDYHANGMLYGFLNEHSSVVRIDPKTGAAEEVLNFADAGLNGVYGASFYQTKKDDSGSSPDSPVWDFGPWLEWHDFCSLELVDPSLVDVLALDSLASGSASDIA